MHSEFLTIDHRLESFVAQFGKLPDCARRLADYEARQHGASWIRRLLGKGVACSYVIGYAHHNQWWTWCFDKRVENSEAPNDVEVWSVEAYDSRGESWTDVFRYNIADGRWN